MSVRARSDFEALAERATAKPELRGLRPVIEKELLHYEILFALDKKRLLNQLTFQGGTSLRLCYGAPRLSEGLDFAGGLDFSSEQLRPMKECVEHRLGKHYGLEVKVKEPQELQAEQSGQGEFQRGGIGVSRWQIIVMTSSGRKDLPAQGIKFEVAAVPAYSREARALHAHYDFLPDGYDNILMLAETLDEIMADKLLSLASVESHVRHRDVWDLRWLKRRGVRVNRQWLDNKIRDYNVSGYPAKVQRIRRRLSEIVESDSFRDEMNRFLPPEVQEQTLRKPEFREYLAREVGELLDEAAG